MKNHRKSEFDCFIGLKNALIMELPLIPLIWIFGMLLGIMIYFSTVFVLGVIYLTFFS